jgi:hypothetical protein
MGILNVALNTIICMILYITRDGVRGVIVPTIQYVIVSAVPYIYIYVYIYIRDCAGHSICAIRSTV